MNKEYGERKSNKHTVKPLVSLCVMWVTSCRLTQKKCLQGFSLDEEKYNYSVTFGTLP